MGRPVSMRVAMVSAVFVGLMLVAAHRADAARPVTPAGAEPATPVISCSVLGNCGGGDTTISGELKLPSLPKPANPYTRGCSKIDRCRDD
ncbi:hypothetical protein GUJ93_ZPchr0001g31860 [Zizania palustris]|uniref:Uncharacterized protein n=1 Tax=Zizania palustris TaxID=103762 RepID=A0A8J5V0T6_ZIZPA|nr:hypothetical protein GUJ93_ZPchr0001g31860 [Zizania palustris]